MAVALSRPARVARRVLIVDDSAVARAAMARALEGDEFLVVGAVPHAGAALAFLAGEAVDVIVLDLELPGTDGLSALPDLIAAGGAARVLVVSSSATDGAAATIQALALGAADTLVKPAAGGLAARFGDMLRDRLRRLGDSDTDNQALAAAPRAHAANDDAYDLVAIGASTGGIHALSGVLRALPPRFSLPILVTQHLPASFMPFFAAQVAVLAARPCDVATDRLRIRPGRIIVAPGDAHLCCVALPEGGGAIRLMRGAAASGCMPSVDPMLASAARVYGDRLLAIILSGMGRDGADGARQVAAAGGTVVVQDEASSVVWGMPGTVYAGGDADAVLSPEQIGRFVGAGRRPS